MEKKHEITEKQLVFLSDFLERKGFLENESKYELMDHLICEFEERGNGNLSQFLSDKLNFIRKYSLNNTNKKSMYYRKLYFKESLREFKLFFTDVKLIPITVLSILIIYFLSIHLNEKVLSILVIISLFSCVMYGFYLEFFKTKKSLRKLEEIRPFGLDVGLPFWVVVFPKFLDYLLFNKVIFSIVWFTFLLFSIAAIIQMEKKKKYLLDKYKHLLN